MSPRHPCARNRSGCMSLEVVGCGRHGLVCVVGARPTPSARVPRSYGYAFGAPPSIQGHGAPGTHAPAWVEARHTCAELP
jgi:hypothetical protein